MTDSEFLTTSHAVLARIEAQVDAWLEDDIVDIDTHRSGGLLELHFPDKSVIVVNTQPPLHELWLAAPSGGFHYRFEDGAWRDTRDGRDFYAVLSECIGRQAGQPLTIAAARPPAAGGLSA